MTGAPAAAPRVRITERPGYLEARIGRRADDPNALDEQLVRLLHGAVDRAEAMPGCRALVLNSASATFCSGLPLDTAADERWFTRRETSPWYLFERLTGCAVVTVAVLDGPAVGGGVALASACDLVLAGGRAGWRCTEALLGLVPAMALPFVARRIGEHRACLMALTTMEVDAARGAEWGLADLVGADGATLLPSALRPLRGCRPEAVRALKAYRREAFPWPPGLADRAPAVLAGRLASPETRRLMDLARPAREDV